MSAINSALEVARELQIETKGLLEEEARVTEAEEELVEVVNGYSENIRKH